MSLFDPSGSFFDGNPGALRLTRCVDLFNQPSEGCPRQLLFSRREVRKGVAQKIFKPSQALPEMGPRRLSVRGCAPELGRQFLGFREGERRFNDPLFDEPFQSSAIEFGQFVEDAPAGGQMSKRLDIAQLNPSQIPSNMAPLLRPKGIFRVFQSAVHSPRGKACLAAQTTLASSRVLAGPRAQAFLISPIQPATVKPVEVASATGAESAPVMQTEFVEPSVSDRQKL